MPGRGGLSEEGPADVEIQGYCDAVKAAIEGQLNKKFDCFVAIAVASQVVEGFNYFVKIHLGNEDYLHARIYKHFLDGPVVDGIQYPKTKDDPVVYIDLD